MSFICKSRVQWQMLLFTILLLFGAGCATKRHAPPMQLQTRITEGGLKLFEFASHAVPQQPMGGPPGGGARGTGGGRSKTSDSKRLLAMLDEAMEQSQYCRQGYVLLGRYAGETVQRLRGECRDRATDEDRQRFPDTIERW